MTHSSKQGGGKHIATGLIDQEAQKEVIGDKQGGPQGFSHHRLIEWEQIHGNSLFP